MDKEPKTIEELQTIRQEWLDANKRNDFNLTELLSGNYTDPSHFIFELLQNADDAKASSINFNLHSDRLEVRHNGIPFTVRNVECITAIGKSTKGSPNEIGKFGLGFKSVFAVTDAPEIHSGQFNFCITDFIYPEIIEGKDITADETLFIFPFSKPNESHPLLKNRIRNIEPTSLLFLRNLREIKWIDKSDSSSGNIIREDQEADDNLIELLIESEDGASISKYFAFSHEFDYRDKEIGITIAFKLDSKDDSDKIVPVKRSQYNVFFPTKIDTHIGFLIHAPFRTTPNREGIPFDNEENRVLLSEVANLIADILSKIRDRGLLKPSFFRTLPINKDFCNRDEYKALFDRIKQEFLSDSSLIPALNNSYTTTRESILARGSGVVELLNKDDCQELFGRSQWLDTAITRDRESDLRNYLMDVLNIPEIDFEDFSRKTIDKFIEKKDDEWMIKFYAILNDNPALWRRKSQYQRLPLRQKPVIRLDDGSHIAPFDENNNLQVYLPTGRLTSFRTIKRSLIEDEGAKKFLEDLGLKRPDLIAEIREHVIPKYITDEIELSPSDYYSDMEKLIRAFRDNKLSDNLFEELKACRIVLATDTETGEEGYYKPTDVYIKSPELEDYFEDYPVRYASIVIVEDKDSCEKLLREIGCNSLIRLVPFHLDSTKIKDLPDYKGKYHYPNPENSTDFKIEGFNDSFLKKITLERSTAAWSQVSNDDFNLTRKGYYKYSYYGSKKEIFEPDFIKSLRYKTWLFDNDGKLRKPCEICIEDLHPDYDRSSERIREIEEKLGFQKDEIRRIEEKHGGKFVAGDELEEYNKWKEQQKLEDEWVPEVKPSDIDAIHIKEYKPTSPRSPKLTKQTPPTRTDDDSEDIDPPNKDRSIKDIKNIGRWGEEFVVNKLKKKNESDVIWHNKQSDAKQPFDIEIQYKNHSDYIEVKSKLGSKREKFSLSANQWRRARKEGINYLVYVVCNAGTEEAMINIVENPYQLWKDGKIDADPVNILL